MTAHVSEEVANISEAVRKPNPLILAKYKATLPEIKMWDIVIASRDRIRREPGMLVLEWTAPELRKLLRVTGGSFYKTLDRVADGMTGRKIGIRDPEKQMFEYRVIVNLATYKDGVFRVEMREDSEPFLYELEKQFYTTLNLDTILSFKKSAYSLKLYEALRMICFPKAKFDKGKEFVVTYKVAELKLILGVINANLDKVTKVLHDSKYPDYEKAVEVAPEKVLEEFKNFRARAIEPAVQEINAISDIFVTYEAQNTGRSGKVDSITFHVRKNDQTVEEKDADPDEVLDFILHIVSPMPTIKEARRIAEAASYDMEKIRKAADALDAYGEAENPVGFLISAIKGSFEGKRKRRAHSTERYEQVKLRVEE